MLRVGLVGLGNMGRNHLRVLTSGFPDRALVTAVADPWVDQVMPEGIARLPHYEMLDPLVDAVVVASPTPTHYEITRHFLRAGKHVLVEKPIAMTVAEARELVRLARRHRVTLQVGLIERFNPAVKVLQGLLEGEHIVAIEAHRLSYFTPSSVYGNLVVDLMIHDIDVVNYLLGNPGLPVSVAAHGQLLGGDFTHVQALLGYANGTTASLNVSRLAHEKVRSLKIYTERKTLSLNYITRELRVSTLGSAHNLEGFRGYLVESGVQHYVVDGEPLYFELRHFLDCIEQGREPETNGEVGTQALQIAEEIRACCLALPQRRHARLQAANTGALSQAGN